MGYEPKLPPPPKQHTLTGETKNRLTTLKTKLKTINSLLYLPNKQFLDLLYCFMDFFLVSIQGTISSNLLHLS